MTTLNYKLQGGEICEAEAKVIARFSGVTYLLTSFPKMLGGGATATLDDKPAIILGADRSANLVLAAQGNRDNIDLEALMRTKNKSLRGLVQSIASNRRFGFCFRETKNEIGVVIKFIFKNSTLPQRYLGKLLVGVGNEEQRFRVTGSGLVDGILPLLMWLEDRCRTTLYIVDNGEISEVDIEKFDCVSGGLRSRDYNNPMSSGEFLGVHVENLCKEHKSSFPQLFFQHKNDLQNEQVVVVKDNNGLIQPGSIIKTVNEKPCVTVADIMEAVGSASEASVDAGNGVVTVSAQILELPIHLQAKEGRFSEMRRAGNGDLIYDPKNDGPGVLIEEINNGDRIRGGGEAYRIFTLLTIKPMSIF